MQLNELKVGQLLQGVLLKNNHLLNGTTGPKVFFECGVGRINPKNKWNMVNGMCRLGSSRKRMKASVLKKRIQRLTRQSTAPTTIQLYVSNIRLDNQQFEVSLSPPSEALELSDNDDEVEAVVAAPPKQRISASQLQPNQEIIGKIIEVRDYGAFVDVNANRNGLLHIQKVADLNDCYIDKSNGLQKAGLEIGTELRVCVESNTKKRLFLDFTADVKEEARLVRENRVRLEMEETVEEEVEEEVKVKEKVMEEFVSKTEVEEEEEDGDENDGPPEYDEAAWADFAAADDYYDDNDKDDKYDEDKDIEDSLGIGYY